MGGEPIVHAELKKGVPVIPVRPSVHARRQKWRATSFQAAALAILLLIVLVGVFAPWITIAPYDSTRFIADAYAFPSFQHPFGVDALGRDYLSRNLYAIRVSLVVGVVTASVGTLIGVPLGLLAGYFGGVADWLVMRVIEIVSVIPPLLVAILLANLIRVNVWTISLIIGLASWVPMARLVRSRVLTVRELPYVESARIVGATPWRILWRTLLPNSVSTIIVAFVLTIPNAIVTEASLSFLGMGIAPPTPDWGQMIASSLSNIYYYWYLGFFPAMMLTVTVTSISVAGDWLRDVFDPESHVKNG